MSLQYFSVAFLLFTSFYKVNCNYYPIVPIVQNKSLEILQTPYTQEQIAYYNNGGFSNYGGSYYWVDTPSNQIYNPLNSQQPSILQNNYIYNAGFTGAGVNQNSPSNFYWKSKYRLSENPKWYPTQPYFFNKKLCQERKHRMDWVNMLKPCKSRMEFGMHMYSYLKTEANYSFVSDLQVRKTGDYSSFRIKTYDTLRNPKTIGGDTWRVFLRGPVYIEPYVYDLNNGEYEVLFFTLDAGMYHVEVILEGSLCSSYVNPPYDWFKKGDFNGHFQNEYMFKEYKGFPFLLTYRIWNSLPNFTIYIHQGLDSRIKVNLSKMKNWQSICNVKCNFLTDGFGRWKNQVWVPFVQKPVKNSLASRHRLRRKQGLLWIYGDCYAYNFYQSIWNTTICTQQFKECNRTYNWIYPRWHPDNKKDKSIHLKHDYFINLPWLVKYFTKLLNKVELNRNDSGMLLNVGLHYIRSTSFEIYKQLIDGYIKAIKSHRTDVVWRTTTAIHRAEKLTHKRFQTNQRALLFNAYSMSAMCLAGIPVIDIFPLTSAIQEKPDDGIHYDVKVFELTKVLEEYYKYL